jgi:hypothetical protein
MPIKIVSTSISSEILQVTTHRSDGDGENEKRITNLVWKHLGRQRRIRETNIAINNTKFCCDDRMFIVSESGLRY